MAQDTQTEEGGPGRGKEDVGGDAGRIQPRAESWQA